MNEFHPPCELNRRDAEDAETRELDAAASELTHAVIGAAIEVHRHLGPGYLESVYEEAFAYELELRRLQFLRQYSFALDYKGKAVGQGLLDFLVENRLIVELKAVEQLHLIHKAQLISYLKALNLNLGLLINFNVPILKDGVKRIVLTK